MGRPKLTEPHVCELEGCGAQFTRGGRATSPKRCPKHYAREYRGSTSAERDTAPAVAFEISLPADVAQRLDVFTEERQAKRSHVIRDAVVAFLDREEALSRGRKGTT